MMRKRLSGSIEIGSKKCKANDLSQFPVYDAIDDDDDEDCVYISPDESDINPIIIDSDSCDGETLATCIARDNCQESQNKKPGLCFCCSIYCLKCLSENTRKKLFKMYICHPIISTHTKMYETVAELANIPQAKVQTIFRKLMNHLLAKKNGLSDLHRLALNGYAGNFPCTMAPLEICQLRRRLLKCKPSDFVKMLGICCRIFKYKIDSAGLIQALTERGNFQFRRISRSNRKSRLIAIEKSETRLCRLAYIQKVQKYRDEGRQIIYINEMQPMETKMIVIAANTDGPITSAYMKTGSAKAFLKWISKDIVANLKEPCVFVLGPSCTFRSDSTIPQQTDSKATIITWLKMENISFESDMYKTELYELVLQHISSCTRPIEYATKIEQSLSTMGHTTLFIPESNHDLDPFEYIWMHIKLRMIANGTASFDINRELCSLPRDVWKGQFDRIDSIENVYVQIERNFDQYYRRFRFDNEDFKCTDIFYSMDEIRC